MSKDTSIRNPIASISVIEPTPKLVIRLAKADSDSPRIVVDGMSPPQAVGLDWIDIIRHGFDLYEAVHGRAGGSGGSSGGDGKGCTTVKITNVDGSTVEIKTCPPPK